MKKREFISDTAKKKLPGEETFRILAKARYDGAISLGLGEPDFQMPDSMFDYICTIRASGYSPPGGTMQLRDLICKKLEKENNILAQPYNIVVTCGATEALFLSGLATINPQDEIILPDPSYVIIPSMFEMLNGRSIPLQLKQEDQFEVNPADMRKLITNRTKIIMLNSPSNPTGSVLNRKSLEEIADIAIEHDLIIFSDEAYEDIIYDGYHHSMASLNGMADHVISFYTFSKTWAIPGFRLGYLCAPPEIAEAVTKLHIYTTFCAPTISQKLGTWILKNSNTLKYQTDNMKIEYRKRRDFLVKRLNELGLKTVSPRGAFYTFSDISDFSSNSLDFANMILEKAKVAVIPGSEFGKYGEGYIRCSYATPIENITEALIRIGNALLR